MGISFRRGLGITHAAVTKSHSEQGGIIVGVFFSIDIKINIYRDGAIEININIHCYP
jgi:hypothetical protein